MENLTVISAIFWPWILANLSIVSFSFSNGGSQSREQVPFDGEIFSPRKD